LIFAASKSLTLWIIHRLNIKSDLYLRFEKIATLHIFSPDGAGRPRTRPQIMGWKILRKRWINFLG